MAEAASQHNQRAPETPYPKLRGWGLPMSRRQNTEFVALLMTVAWLGTGLAVGGDSSPAKTTPQAIEGAVICQCPCNMTVSACNHEGCASKAEMQALAEKEVASGKGATTILQDFVLRYGVKVLATPPPNGFNLTVWILPALGAIVGLALAVLVVRRWRRPLAGATPAETAAVDREILAEVEEEMRRVMSNQ